MSGPCPGPRTCQGAGLGSEPGRLALWPPSHHGASPLWWALGPRCSHHLRELVVTGRQDSSGSSRPLVPPEELPPLGSCTLLMKVFGPRHRDGKERQRRGAGRFCKVTSLPAHHFRVSSGWPWPPDAACPPLFSPWGFLHVYVQGTVYSQKRYTYSWSTQQVFPFVRPWIFLFSLEENLKWACTQFQFCHFVRCLSVFIPWRWGDALLPPIPGTVKVTTKCFTDHPEQGKCQ